MKLHQQQMDSLKNLASQKSFIQNSMVSLKTGLLINDDSSLINSPHLLALPCTSTGKFLPPWSKPAPCADNSDGTENPYAPFDDQLAFDWAYYHFIELQSSKQKVNKGLDLWLAAVIKASQSNYFNVEDCCPPWSTASELYSTIDCIQDVNVPFTTVQFKYTGELPENPPAWMMNKYELCTHDAHVVLHHQLSTSDLASQFNYQPYWQFDHSGDCVWSNLFSGDWAWNEAVRSILFPPTVMWFENCTFIS